jgi:thioredoxin 1
MLEVTDATFEEEILRADQPALVDFWAAWCGPCRMIAPIVEELAEEYDGRLLIAKMDVDTNPNTPGRLAIRGIPTLILFKNGEEVERLVGVRPKAALVDAIEPHLA